MREYTAKRSALSEVTFFRIVLSIFIIPFIYMIIRMIIAKYDTIEFYEDHIIERRGVFNIREKRSAFVGIVSVSVSQTLLQRIFDFGNVTINAAGKLNINTYGVTDPTGLKNYLNTRVVKSTHMFVN